MKRLIFLLILTVFVIALAMQAIPTQAYSVTAWSGMRNGIWVASGSATSPRLMRAFAYRIDLQNHSVVTKISSGNGGAPYDCNLEQTDGFLISYGCNVATNCCHWDVNTPSPYADVLGLLMPNGVVVSSPGGLWPGQMNFRADRSLYFLWSGSVPGDAVNGLEIGDQVLTNGVPTTFAPAINPYTGYGLSQDGRYLIAVCVDGRQPGYSEGCYYSELGQWLKDFGAWNGVHADGGGSTCIVRSDVGVWNSPCYGYVRAVAASIGFSSDAWPVANRAWGPVVSNCDLRQMLFATFDDNHVRCNVETGVNSNGFTTWSEFGGSFSGTVATGVHADSRVEIFVRGTDGIIYSRYQLTPGQSYSPWSGHGGSHDSNPTVGRTFDGRLYLLARTGGTVQKRHQSIANGGWAGAWANVAGGTGIMVGDPAIENMGDGRLMAFSLASDGQIYSSNQSTAYSDTWTAWSGHGLPTTFVGNPKTSHFTNGRVAVFCRDTNGNIWYRYQTTSMGSWGSWVNLGHHSICATAGDPVIARNPNGKMQLFVRGANGNIFTLIESASDSTTWNAWSGLYDKAFVGDPEIGMSQNNRILVFCRASDNCIYRCYQTVVNGTSSWSTWSGCGNGHITDF